MDFSALSGLRCASRRLFGVPALVLAGVSCVVGFVPQRAAAELIGDLVTVHMSDGQRSANASFRLPPELPSQVPERVQWMLQQKFEMRTEQNEWLGTIDDLRVNVIGDPVVGISFDVTAGPSDVDVTISSATLAFPTLISPPASAEAEMTLFDNGGDPGASIGVADPNGGLFRAVYNDTLEYVELLGDTSISNGSVVSMFDENDPISGPVSRIRADWAFGLSAGDRATGSGTFTVVPEPASAVLFAVGIATALPGRRRRHPLRRAGG
jgi:hypothetical protein